MFKIINKLSAATGFAFAAVFIATAAIIFWGVIGYVILHFITKFW